MTLARSLLICGLIAFAGSSLALAQLVPTVPEAPKKSPAFTPPPAPALTPTVTPMPAPAGAPQQLAPAPAPAQAAAPAIKAPDLIKRDAQGKVIRLQVPTEEAALSMLELDPSTIERRMLLTMERRARQDALIVEFPTDALKLRDTLRDINTITEPARLVASRTLMNKLVIMSKSYSQFMAEGGGITSQEQRAIIDGNTAYVKAITEEVNEQVRGKGDPTLSMIAYARANVPRSCMEFNREFNRMLVETGKQWSMLRPLAGDLSKASTIEGAISSAKDDDARASAVAAVFATMEPEAMSAVLKKVATPLPEKPLVQMDPGNRQQMMPQTIAPTPMPRP